MNDVNFTATKEDFEVAAMIAERATAMHTGIDHLSMFMDILATHTNGCPLKLGELLAAPDMDFTHDIFEIMRHINRRSGKMGGFFLPRYADIKMLKPLELTDEMVARNDEIDNAVFDCITSLAENPDMEWDMAIIGDVTDSIKCCLYRHGVKVRHPAVVTDQNGGQSYSEYGDYETEGA